MKVNTNIKIEPRNIVKFATRVVSGATASYVTERVANHVFAEEDLTLSERVRVKIGVGSVGIAVGNIVGKETDELVDVVFDTAGRARKVKMDVEEPEIIDHED